MKRLTIRETPYTGSAVSIMGPEGERRFLGRVTNDGSPKFNTVILYEPEDEIYEHWDAMYCWEEPEPPIKPRTGVSSIDYWKGITYPKPTYSGSILLDEMRRSYDYKIGWIPEGEKIPIVKNLTEDT